MYELWLCFLIMYSSVKSFEFLLWYLLKNTLELLPGWLITLAYLIPKLNYWCPGKLLFRVPSSTWTDHIYMNDYSNWYFLDEDVLLWCFMCKVLDYIHVQHADWPVGWTSAYGRELFQFGEPCSVYKNGSYITPLLIFLCLSLY